MIAPCTCKNKGQDELHGKGKRVMNVTTATRSQGTKVYRCTVCLSLKESK